MIFKSLPVLPSRYRHLLYEPRAAVVALPCSDVNVYVGVIAAGVLEDLLQLLADTSDGSFVERVVEEEEGRFTCWSQHRTSGLQHRSNHAHLLRTDQ